MADHNATAGGVTSVAGKTTLDDKMSFEPERLAYVSAGTVAGRIAKRVVADVGTTRPVVISGGELMADLTNLAATEMLLKQVVAQYKTCEALGEAMTKAEEGDERMMIAASAAAAAGLPGVAPLLTAAQSAIALLGLFREDVEYRGAKTEVDQMAFRFALAAHLKDKGVDVRTYDTALPAAPAAGASAIEQALADAEAARVAAWTALAPHLAALAEAQAQLDSAARMPNNAAAVQNAAKDVTALRQKISPVSDALDRADAQFSHLRTQLEKVDDTTGMMTLGKLLRAERMKAGNPALLHVRIVSSGGHHRVTQPLWRTMFWGPDVSAMGGVVARWALLETNGAFRIGGIEDQRTRADYP